MTPFPQIPGYDILRALGGGPVTHVFAAQELGSGREVAVKTLRPEFAADPTSIKLLRREARAGLSVRHRHLVRVVVAHVTRPPYYLVMALLGGESLRDRLRRDFSLHCHNAVWIARQTAEALAALHRAEYVHGDTKPANIQMADAGTAVLIDLGCAHRPGENAELLRDGYLLGTADYLAPELCDFQSDHQFASDWFSFGLILFEMLTGRRPYPPANLNDTLEHHRRDDVARQVRGVSFGWPRRLTALIEGLLDREPGNRHTGTVVVNELIALEIVAIGSRRVA